MWWQQVTDHARGDGVAVLSCRAVVAWWDRTSHGYREARPLVPATSFCPPRAVMTLVVMAILTQIR
jgi:hypothetical protein